MDYGEEKRCIRGSVSDRGEVRFTQEWKAGEDTVLDRKMIRVERCLGNGAGWEAGQDLGRSATRRNREDPLKGEPMGAGREGRMIRAPWRKESFA